MAVMDGGGAPGFESWYRRVYPRLVVALAGYAGSPDVASDAADEAMVRAYERWRRVATMESPDGWVYRTALNEVRRHFRRRSAEQDRVWAQMGSVPAPWEPVAEVWGMLHNLPERQRQAVVLRYLADLTEADIAAAMGVRRGTVSRTLRDAMKNLRGELGITELERGAP